MGLFQRRSETGTSAPLYTIAAQKTILIVGLGNVGNQYDRTRHNVGFECIDAYAHQNNFPKWIEKKDLKCLFTKQQIGSTTVILIKPTTYMNVSGEAVQAVQYFYKLPANNILVMHDDVDIPFGEIRTKFGGGDAGHNGLKSIIKYIGNDFNRIRVGAANDKMAKISLENFVLMAFSSDEQRHMATIFHETEQLITTYITNGTIEPKTITFAINNHS